jgi:hypothetical protein
MHHRTWRAVVSAVLALTIGGRVQAFQCVDPSPAARTPLPARPFVVDVREFGARADGKTDSAPGFQLAIDTLAARMAKHLPPKSQAIGTVLVPASPEPYRFARPVWVDHPGIEVRGEGPGSRIEVFPGGHCHPLFLFGLRRVATIPVKGKDVSLVVDARYRPDLYGRLDTSAAPAPATRWGFRSRGETLIQAQATPLSDGARHSRGDFTTDHWTETTSLTIEAAYEVAGDNLPKGMPLFGMGVPTKGRPAPFVLYTGEEAGQIWVQFATQSEPFAPIATRMFSLRVPPAKGVRRLSIQIDLKAAKVSAFMDGIQVATSTLMGPPLGPGLHFAENDYFPFLVADGGGDRPGLGSANGIDWILYGLLLSRTIRYTDDAPGRPQRRADRGGRIDDRYRYFTLPADDPGQVGHFAFTDPPDAGRLLTIQGGPASHHSKAMAFIHHSMSNGQGGILGNALRDVQLVGGNLYGQNVAVGQVLELKLTGIRSEGSYHAIGSLSHGANYTVKLEECNLSGNDSGYFALDQILWARNNVFGTAGRATMRFVGCTVRMENTMVSFHVPGNQSTIKIHAGDYGGNYSFDHMIVDYEGDSYTHTAIYCESHPYTPATSLRLTDIFLGSVGETIPVLTLRDVSPRNPSAFLSVDNLQAFNKKVGAVVDVDSPLWKGELRGVAVGEGERIHYRGQPGTTSRIVVHE